MSYTNYYEKGKNKEALHGTNVIHGRVMLLNFNLCEQLNFN